MKTYIGKYRPFPVINLADRQWPSRQISQAPTWCSVDLRDGNQALINPMSVSQKLELWNTLLEVGFKEIEVGFPSASNTDFQFVRHLIKNDLIPNDVTIQVLVQATEPLIEMTIESLAGAKRAIIHLYNSTSPAQRRVVFQKSKEEIVALAVQGTKMIRQGLDVLPDCDVRFEYSPESFSATEIEFSVEVCEAVIQAWGPTNVRPIILNLPETVQVAMPNVYADQIEYFLGKISSPDAIVLSVHTHNDRGTGVASTELALLAGAQRVEGTLFGNGERTGNADIVTLALNMYMHGIDTQLDFSSMQKIQSMYEKTTGMSVHSRHPYVGELVFSAMSGSHQDAIAKGMKERERLEPNHQWDVPYLSIDPADIGRKYEKIIRVNSQSGKGGIAYLLRRDFHIDLPKPIQKEFGLVAGDLIDKLGREVSSQEIHDMFIDEYVRRESPWKFVHFQEDKSNGEVHCSVELEYLGEKFHLHDQGNGPIEALIRALCQIAGKGAFNVVDYSAHALEKGAEAQAISYVCIEDADGRRKWGAGISSRIDWAPVFAVFSALNRLESGK